VGFFLHVLRYTVLYGGLSVGRPRAAARRGAAHACPHRSARSERGKPSSRGVPRHPGKRLGAQLAVTLHHPAPSRKVIRAVKVRPFLKFPSARITFRDGAGWCSVVASCAPSLFPGCLGTPREDGFPLSDRAERWGRACAAPRRAAARGRPTDWPPYRPVYRSTCKKNP